MRQITSSSLPSIRDDGVHIVTRTAWLAVSTASPKSMTSRALGRCARLTVVLRIGDHDPSGTDRRRFEDETVQADAITPDVLVRIVREAIEARIDPAALATTLAREGRDRDRLMANLDRSATER